MKKTIATLLLCLYGVLGAQEHKTPQQIQEQLDIAEEQLERAKEMFNPWYTGPLLTPSASMMPPGYGGIQPYVFVNDTYAAFNAERESVSLDNNIINLNPVLIVQTGLTRSMDFTVVFQTNTTWRNGECGGGLGDTVAVAGFMIQPESVYVPKVKFSLAEFFPTGRYQNLHLNGLNVSGAGCYATQFSFAAGKILFWATKHPVNARIALAYKVPTSVKVSGVNAYGGGFGTKGTVHPGNTFSADFGIEMSLTQRWVIASDFVYTATNQTTFSGDPGFIATGPAPVGKGFSDQFSLAPAIEYNWNAYLGVLGGVQFTVYGRNSSNFISAIISLNWVFP